VCSYTREIAGVISRDTDKILGNVEVDGFCEFVNEAKVMRWWCGRCQHLKGQWWGEKETSTDS